MAYVYLGIAVGAALSIVAMAVRRLGLLRRGRRLMGEEGEPLPPTVLERRAWWWLAVGLGVALISAVGVVLGGPTQIQQQPELRLLGWGVLFGGLLLAVVGGRRLRPAAGEVELDERDLAILARAPAWQAGMVLTLLAVWSVALTEAYQQVGQVPLAFIGLIFWSCLVAHMVALPLGILAGYREAGLHGSR